MKSRSSSSQTTLISTHSPSSQRQANLTISDAKLDHEEKNGNKKSPSKKRSANDSSKAASSPKTSPKVQKIKVSSPPSSPASSFSQSNPNEDIVKILKELADYERTVTRQIHKYNAYRKAAASISKYPTRILSGKEAMHLEGVGAKIAGKIDEILATGSLHKLEEIHGNENNAIILELTRVNGIGPVAAQKLVHEHGISSIEDLRQNAGHLELTHSQKIGLKYLEEFEQPIPRAEMCRLVAVLVREAARLDARFSLNACGSFRRGKATSGDLDVLVTHPAYIANSKGEKGELLHRLVKHLEGISFVTDTISLGDNKFAGVCRLREEDLQPHAFSDEELQRVGQLECSPSLPSSSSASPSQQQQAAEVAGRRDRDRDGDEEGDEGAPQKQETGPSLGADAGVGAGVGVGAGDGAHRRLDLRLVPVDHLACAMLYFTGSNVFNQGMRAHALQLGFTLNEYSLRRVGSTGVVGEPVPLSSEEDIFEYLSVPYRPPHLRESW